MGASRWLATNTMRHRRPRCIQLFKLDTLAHLEKLLDERDVVLGAVGGKHEHRVADLVPLACQGKRRVKPVGPAARGFPTRLPRRKRVVGITDVTAIGAAVCAGAVKGGIVIVAGVGDSWRGLALIV